MKYLLIGLILSSSAFAEVFKINGEMLDFQNKDGLLLQKCEKDCIALKTVASHKKINLKAARAKETFVGSVGSDVCRLVYQANSVLGVNQSLDQRAFCVFKDDSAIEINSLTEYLSAKKIVVE